MMGVILVFWLHTYFFSVSYTNCFCVIHDEKLLRKQTKNHGDGRPQKLVSIIHASMYMYSKRSDLEGPTVANTTISFNIKSLQRMDLRSRHELQSAQ